MIRDDDFEVQEVAVAKFETERLVLRPFEAKDAAGLFEMLSHPRIHASTVLRLTVWIQWKRRLPTLRGEAQTPCNWRFALKSRM